MRSYYYLAASLPPLEFPHLPSESFVSLEESLRTNLTQGDQKQVMALRLFADILNIRPLFLAEEIDAKGNLSEKELEEALLHQLFFPSYVFSFLEKYTTLEDKLAHFPELLTQFFVEESEQHEGFLRKFFTFEREWRLVLLALRAKRLQRDVVQELQFEDPLDPFVLQILMQKDAADYEPPKEYQDVKELFLLHLGDPVLQNQALARYRFFKVQEMWEDGAFSLDRILGYLSQVMILEYWNRLDSMRGKMILDTFKTS